MKEAHRGFQRGMVASTRGFSCKKCDEARDEDKKKSTLYFTIFSFGKDFFKSISL